MMAYKLEGRMLEVCDCKVLCPCWVGETPDNGTCRGMMAYHAESGRIDDIDVSGLTVAMAVFIPGNALAGNWRAAIYIDDRATEAQYQALLSVYKGERGGPVADMVQLVGEVVSVERAPIAFHVDGGNGTFKIGPDMYADIEPFVGPTGKPTHLVDAIFSTIPGSPFYVAKARKYRNKNSRLGIDLTLEGHNAIQGHFSFQA
jgi:hypothetical protein